MFFLLKHQSFTAGLHQLACCSAVIPPTFWNAVGAKTIQRTLTVWQVQEPEARRSYIPI